MKNARQLIKQFLVAVLASRHISASAVRLFGYGIPVFMLHRLAPDGSGAHRHTPAYLRDCLQFLHDRGHTFVSLEDIITALDDGAPLPEKPVAFTMDDGFNDQATLAAPVFIEFECPVTIFLISGMLDGDLWPWDDKVAFLIRNTDEKAVELSISGEDQVFRLDNDLNRSAAITTIQNRMKKMDGKNIPDALRLLSETAQVDIPETPPASYQPMTWDMARNLEKRGVCFAPHTVSHRILSKLSAEEAATEIDNSWQRLRDELSSPVPIFCYPTGRAVDFAEREIDLLKKSGFTGAVSTIPAHINIKDSSENYRYSLPRYGLPDNFCDFMQYSTWIEYAKNRILHR